MQSILVIDDDAVLRGRILAALQAQGFKTFEAGNGAEGLRLARSQRPDLIISDVHMEEADGYEVLDTLRKDSTTATIPLILITGQADQPGMRRGMEQGADDYLPKPFSVKELLATVEARLKKNQSMLRQAEEKLEELRVNISASLPHELRTPLTGIMGFADIIRTQIDSLQRAEILEMAGEIYDSGVRLNRAIQNYLSYAETALWATNADKVTALRREMITNPAKLIGEAAQQMAERHRRPNDLNLVLRDATVAIASGHLTKILHELLDNAFKFSAAGSPIHIETAVDESVFQLAVADHGRGMTPQQIADIGAYMQFEREFYEQQGSGMGLAIVKQIVELHGGKLSFGSGSGSGTTVRLSLPLAQSQRDL